MDLSRSSLDSHPATEPGTGDPIRSVTVVTTGCVQIHPQQVVGSRVPQYAWIAASRKWLRPRPINAYLIDHAKGLVLFDTGQDRASVTDPSYFPAGATGWLYGRLARFQIGPRDTLAAKFAEVGRQLGDVNLAILSHLHEDHIGGIGELGAAELLVSDTEWRSMLGRAPELRGYLRRHIDLPGLRVNRIRFAATREPALRGVPGAFDVMGDGSLVLIPTPGHTAGSMSLLVRRKGSPSLLLVGDLTYELEVMEAGRVPGVGDRRLLRASTSTVLALRASMPDLVILPAHDPGAAERLRQAPPPLRAGAARPAG